MPLKKPDAVLLDLDDTLVAFSAPRVDYWNTVTKKHESSISPVTAVTLSNAIIKSGDWFWGDNGRNMKWRLYLREARRQIVELAFADLGIDNIELAHTIADDFSDLREKGDNILMPVPGSIETVKHLRSKGIKLALLTNGSSKCQRSKIDRFNLTPLFEKILIEEETGFGKPDPRIYLKALYDLGVEGENSWMIGDNPLWDVAAPQKLGIKGIWINRNGASEPRNLHPFLTVNSLADVKKYVT